MGFRLLDLPAEVIQNICRQAEKYQLKSLSLTCKRVHGLAAPILFNSLVLGRISGESTGSLAHNSLWDVDTTTWTYVRHLRMQISPFDRARDDDEDQDADTDWENEEDDLDGARRFKHAVSIERARKATCVWRNCLALMRCLSSLTVSVNLYGLRSMEEPTSAQQWHLYTNAITWRTRLQTQTALTSLRLVVHDERLDWTGPCWPLLFSPFEGITPRPNLVISKSSARSWESHASLCNLVPSHIGELTITGALVADLKEFATQVCLTRLGLSLVSQDQAKEAFQLINCFSDTLETLTFENVYKGSALGRLGYLRVPQLRRLEFSRIVALEAVATIISATQLKRGCTMEIAQECLTEEFGEPAVKRFCTAIANTRASPVIEITWVYAPGDNLDTLCALKSLDEIVVRNKGTLRLHIEFERYSVTDHTFSNITEMLATLHRNDLDMCLSSLVVDVADITLPSSPLDRITQDSSLIHLSSLQHLTLRFGVAGGGWITFGLNRMLNILRMPRLDTLEFDFYNKHGGQQLSVLEANLPYYPWLASVSGSILVAPGEEAPPALKTFQQKCREIGTRGHIHARTPVRSPSV